MDISKLDSFVYYQDKNFYYFWKPAWLSSSRWKSVSFLDLFEDDLKNQNIRNIVKSQKEFFDKEKEYWLLNRLDSATTGLLYFAKNPKVYYKFRELQQEEKIDKYYIAEVYWNIQNWINVNWNEINVPIMHHKFSDDRMITVPSEEDKSKWKWKLHYVSTKICEVDYNDKDNLSIILIKIHKGIRHQIRIHLSSIWFPICGDNIYCKSKNQNFDKLQLFSVGMEVDWDLL